MMVVFLRQIYSAIVFLYYRARLLLVFDRDRREERLNVAGSQ